MRGVEALEYFLETWHGKMNKFRETEEFEAMIEYAFGSKKKVVNTKVVVEKYYDKKIKFENLAFEDLKTCFLPEDVEFDPHTGNLYINRSLYKIKIAPRIY